MLSVEEYQQILFGHVTPTDVGTVRVAESLGLHLAADLACRHDLPPWDNSAMDGYAVRAADLMSLPAVLTVIEDIPAGSSPRRTVGAGEAARIMTGAPVPPGADTVVRVEDTDAGLDRVTVVAAPAPGANIRRRGEDRRTGDQVARAGELLTPQRSAALAAAGHGVLEVFRRPRVAVVTTGDELVDPGAPLGPGSIPDSNGVLVETLLADAGVACGPVRRSSDEEADLAAILHEVSVDADAVVLTGGVSVGARDVVKAVLAPRSTTVFTHVAMQPGKPQGCGRLEDGTVVFALPGNPVSVWVSFHVLVAPALRLMGGGRPASHTPITAVARTGWRTSPGRRQYLPAVIGADESGRLQVGPVTERGSGSHLAARLADANGYAVIPAQIDQVEAGDEVEVVYV